MKELEPQIISTIIVRPAYTEDGQPYKTASYRWIGELYVNGEKRVETSDYDRKHAAYISVQKAIQRDPKLLDIKKQVKS